MANKKKTKSKKKLWIALLIVVVLAIVSSQFFSLDTDEDFTSKYTFKDNEIDLKHNDIRIAPKIYLYSGNQLTWGWFNKNREKIYPVYGSISSRYTIEGDITNKYDTSLLSYEPKPSNNLYCKDLGHSGAFSIQSSQRKKSIVFERDLENCDRTTADYPNDCTYWRKESNDMYYATKIWCYNENEFISHTKFQTIEPEMLDGYYNTFELDYNVTLNGQYVKPYIIIDNVTYYLNNNKKEFDSAYKPNTKVYYGFELMTDGTNTPIINNPKEIKLVTSFAEPEKEEQQGQIESIDVTAEEEILSKNIIEESNVKTIVNEEPKSEPVVTDAPMENNTNQTVRIEKEESVLVWIMGVFVVAGIIIYYAKNRGKTKKK